MSKRSRSKDRNRPDRDISEDADVAHIRDNPLRRLMETQRPYVLTRFVLLRLLGLVYFTAFWVAFQQIRPLLGTNGLLPARGFLDYVITQYGSPLDAFRQLPTLLIWFGASDGMLMTFAGLGLVLSLAVLGGVTNAVVQFTLWLLYLSLSRVGQIFYGYGWEIQLLETGFLSIFLCPIREFRPFSSAPPAITMILYRWLIVRIMLGAGLIKLRGDPCWRDLTCLVFHYETQPIPSPMSLLFHEMPVGFNKFGVGFNHVVELIAPLFAFWPRPARLVAGCLFIVFQLTLISSGNLSFLNWLTIVPAIACFDDDALEKVLPKRLKRWAASQSFPKPAQRQVITAFVAAAFIAFLSIEPVRNLFSDRQRMNSSFNPLALVNTYGAFGSVDRERFEVILEGTSDTSANDRSKWLEYEFPCKPGDPKRRPCIITPYHYRLDWQLWFAAKSNVDRQPWFLHLVDKLLRGETTPKSLLAHDPFPDKPPRFLRARLYRYRFTRVGDGKNAWWERDFVREWMPPIGKDDPRLERMLISYGLKKP